MRFLSLVVFVVLAAAVASASVLPKDFHSSHGHKKLAKESEREDAEGTKVPVKVHSAKAPPAAHKPSQGAPRPVIHPIPSHPPPHAEDVEANLHHHQGAPVSGPTPVIHPIVSHPPPAEPTKPTAVVTGKEPKESQE